jgi:zinc D-Ala-D-Ala dipeptidase
MKKVALLVLVISGLISSQQISYNQYGLQVVSDILTYNLLVEADSTKLLVDLEDYIPGILLEIRYASGNNFYGHPVYPYEKAFLRLPAAEALRSVQLELLKEDKTLKIYDAYRPYSVTLLFYEKIKDTNFVASAWSGSRHNRGCSVDLTIVDQKTGKELKMPTDYDDFTERAAVDFADITEEEKFNRELLITLMQSAGFVPLRSEWWHYDFNNWKKFELSDLSFEELEKSYIEFKEIKYYGR